MLKVPPIHTLPNELFVGAPGEPSIFEHLEPKELARIARVDRRFEAMSRDDNAWRPHLGANDVYGPTSPSRTAYEAFLARRIADASARKASLRAQAELEFTGIDGDHPQPVGCALKVMFFQVNAALQHDPRYQAAEEQSRALQRSREAFRTKAAPSPVQCSPDLGLPQPE